MKRLAFLFLVAAFAFVAVAHGDESKSSAAAATEAADEAHDKTTGGDEAHGTKMYGPFPEWLLQGVNLVLFIGLLVYLLKKPIAKAMNDRRQQIKSDLEQAAVRRQKADQLASDIQARLTQIEREVESIHQRAEEEGEKQKQEMIAAAKAEAEKILSVARNEVDARVKAARQELTEYAGELATSRAHDLLQESLTDDDRRRFFKESLGRIGEKR